MLCWWIVCTFNTYSVRYYITHIGISFYYQSPWNIQFQGFRFYGYICLWRWLSWTDVKRLVYQTPLQHSIATKLLLLYQHYGPHLETIMIHQRNQWNKYCVLIVIYVTEVEGTSSKSLYRKNENTSNCSLMGFEPIISITIWNVSLIFKIYIGNKNLF